MKAMNISMTPSMKVAATVVLVVLAYCVSVAVGVYRLTSSEVFPMAKLALANYLAPLNSPDAKEPYHLKWWSSWHFRDGYSSGEAEFFLCTPQKRCYTMKAFRVNGKWVVTEAIPPK